MKKYQSLYFISKTSLREQFAIEGAIHSTRHFFDNKPQKKLSDFLLPNLVAKKVQIDFYKEKLQKFKNRKAELSNQIRDYDPTKPFKIIVFNLGGKDYQYTFPLEHYNSLYAKHSASLPLISMIEDTIASGEEKLEPQIRILESMVMGELITQPFLSASLIDFSSLTLLCTNDLWVLGKQVLINTFRRFLSLKIFRLLRDLRRIIRHIIRFHFKNLDDEEANLLTLQKRTNQQNTFKILKYETRYQSDRKRYRTVTLAA